MLPQYRRDQLALFGGDLIVLGGSLWLALFVRHFAVPSGADLVAHTSFLILFVVSLFIFISVGLYDKHIALFEHRLPTTISEAQIVNLIIAVLFFFLVPIAIQPKTVLVLYFLISTALIVVWRLGVFPSVVGRRACEPVVIVGTGAELHELATEIQHTPQSRFACADYLDSAGMSDGALQKAVTESLRASGATTVVSGVRVQFSGALTVIPATLVYEALFERVPLTLVDPTYIGDTGSTVRAFYSFFKRIIDLVLSFGLLVVLALLTPLVYIAIRLEGPGPLFITQERIGRGWTTITVYKFRTMTSNDSASGSWVGEGANRVTRVGAFLRLTSIDELPQVFSVFIGALSLIGPRSDIRGLGERLQDEIPLYRMRYLVTPGISGWAQVNQKYAPGNISPQSVEESRVRLQYDLYYIKYRSLLLDLSITLKTLKTLIKRIIP